jgi:polar amino acid transport system substrate-binding protein
MMPFCRAAAITAACLLAPLAGASEDAITVTYSERPPYMMAQPSGVPSGLTATQAAQAFKAAGIPAVWQNLPTNRQLMMIKDPGLRVCAIGWFWVPEREQFAKFTKPIYRDKEWLVLANANLAARAAPTLEALLRHKETRILVKDNFSYGGELDALMRKWGTTRAVSTALTSKMVQSISKGVVDMMFVSEEEGTYILAHHPADQTRNLRLLRFKDMPRGPDRHIMCSKSVPDDVIARLNKAITFK